MLAYWLYGKYGYIIPLDITIYKAASWVGGRINLIDNYANGYAGFINIRASLLSADDLYLLIVIDNIRLRQKVVKALYLKTVAGV